MRTRRSEPGLFDGQRPPRRPRLIDRIFGCFTNCPGLTADEAALMLQLAVTSVRPRVTDLVSTGRLVDTGARRPGVSGFPMAVWKVADATASAGAPSPDSPPEGRRAPPSEPELTMESERA